MGDGGLDKVIAEVNLLFPVSYERGGCLKSVVWIFLCGMLSSVSDCCKTLNNSGVVNTTNAENTFLQWYPISRTVMITQLREELDKRVSDDYVLASLPRTDC